MTSAFFVLFGAYICDYFPKNNKKREMYCTS